MLTKDLQSAKMGGGKEDTVSALRDTFPLYLPLAFFNLLFYSIAIGLHFHL